MQKNTFKKIGNTLAKAMALSAFMLLFVTAGQAMQLLKSTNDLRQHALSAWQADHPDQHALVTSFKRTCLYPPKSSPESIKKSLEQQKPLVTWETCGESIGAHALVEAIKQSDAQLRSYAWPLSYFNE